MTCGRSMHAMDFSQLIVFHGDVSQNLAHVYVQLSVAVRPTCGCRARYEVLVPRSRERCPPPSR